MRQLRKVAVTQHSLPYQHFFSYNPEMYKETHCSSAKQVWDDSEVSGMLRFSYTSLIELTLILNQVDPGSNRKVTTCILLTRIFLRSTEMKCVCVTEQHTLNTKTRKHKEKGGFPFKMCNVDALSKVSKVNYVSCCHVPVSPWNYEQKRKNVKIRILHETNGRTLLQLWISGGLPYFKCMDTFNWQKYPHNQKQHNHDK